LIAVVALVVGMFVPFPLSYPVIVGVIIIIVWLIHRRSRHVSP